MRQKELRIALVCYGGVSLAVYMHGVTKELWKLARASRAFLSGAADMPGSEGTYLQLLRLIEREHGLRLRVLPDIIAGASAGGINGIFLAQAIHSGQSLDPLTDLWLERADVDVLLDPEARPWTRFSKFWAMPLVYWLLKRPGNVVSSSVAAETRAEVRAKLSRLIRSRWFKPPFEGLGFSRLLAQAFDAMAAGPVEAPLLPPGHPLDVFVTATDFSGHLEELRLNSPPVVQESEHRVSIGFRAATPVVADQALASPLELVFAARATASFPGAFPPLQVREIDRLAIGLERAWPGRERFLGRILPEHAMRSSLESVSLIDGSVLVNAPFADAMRVLRDRPAQREVDRRFVYIDPHPDQLGEDQRRDPKPPGFFSVILGSLSSIPREQPIRDNLEQIALRSREQHRLRAIVDAIRPEVEQAIEKLFGLTLFFDRPNMARLASWRAKARRAAATQAGYAQHGYAEVRLAAVIDDLAQVICAATPQLGLTRVDGIAKFLTEHLASHGLDGSPGASGADNLSAQRFFLDHDLSYRIRRLRLLARRLSEDWEDIDVADTVRERAREAVFKALARLFDREGPAALGADFAALALSVRERPAAVLDAIAAARKLEAVDAETDAILVGAMSDLPRELRRRIMLTYLGFPYYDTVTLPLLRGDGLTEFDPAKIDRISPDDATSIRSGGASATLRGVEFFNFGAFFSRSYRENDYLWGRLHGAERMLDLLASALPSGAIIAPEVMTALKRALFLAILDEEEPRLKADPGLVSGLRAEVSQR